MKKNRTKKVFAFVLALCMMLTLPVAAFAEWVEDNPNGITVDLVAAEDIMDANNGTVTTLDGEINHNYGTVVTNNGTMSYNYGVVTTNKNEVIENISGAQVVTNESSIVTNNGTVSMNAEEGVVDWNNNTIETNNGEIYTNEGTVKTNNGTIDVNFGTVTVNNGTVQNNLGGTVNGGTVVNEFKYLVNAENAVNVLFNTADGEGFFPVAEGFYIKENISYQLEPDFGYQFDGAPTATGGTITDNGDGTYTLSGITGDIALSAKVKFLPVSDVTLEGRVFVGVEYYLNSKAIITPKNAPHNMKWEVIDAGTTGAVIEDPEIGCFTATAEGTVKVKLTIEGGLGEETDFIKEFTLTVEEGQQALYEAHTALKEALADSDLEKLDKASAAFENMLDYFNAMNEEQLEKLGTLLGVTGEEAFYMVLGDWIDTSLILQMAGLAKEYENNPGEESAAALAEQYELLFVEYEEEYASTCTLVRKFVPNIDQLANAAAGKEDNSNDGESAGGGTSSEDNSTGGSSSENEAPKAGDSSALILWIVLAALAAAAVILLVRKKQMN